MPVVMVDLIIKEAELVTGFGQSNSREWTIDIIERRSDHVRQMIIHTFLLRRPRPLSVDNPG